MLDLTREERKVVLFLLTMAMAGTGLGYMQKKRLPPAKFFYIDEALLRVDLNKADINEILRTKAVPRSLAARIMDYRRDHGAFRTLEEVTKVKGVGACRYEKIKEFFYVN